MNHKKIGLLVIASASILLAGCGNQAKNMTFEDTYNAFLDGHASKGVDLFTSLSSAPALTEKGNYTIKGDFTSGFIANLAVEADSTVSNSGLDTDSTIAISGQLTQPGMTDVVSVDSDILFKVVAGQSYINLSKVSLTSSEGNPQVSMISALSAVLTNKWISLASSGVSTASLQSLNLSTLYTFPALLVNSLKAHPIFAEKSKEMVDGSPVYHVTLDASGLYLVAQDVVSSEAVKAFLNGTTFTDEELQTWAQTFVTNAGFDATMSPKTEKNVILTINNINLDDTESAKGTVEADKSHFEVSDLTENSGAALAFADLVNNGDKTTFSISVPTESVAMTGNVNITNANSSAVAYTLGLNITHPSFNVNLNGNVNVKKADAITVQAPSSFQTIDEILAGFGSLVGGEDDLSGSAQ